MNVAFSAAALDDEASARHLTAILWMFMDGRHQWIIEDDRAIHDSVWLNNEGDSLRRRAKEHVTRAARRMTHVQVMVMPRGTSISARSAPDDTMKTLCIPADRAERYLGRPVILVVENARCDGAFFQHIMLRVGTAKLRRKLGDAGFDELQRRWNSPLGDGTWFAVRHGGGGTTADQIELLIESSPDLPPRFVVLTDSDRGSPTDDLGSTASKVQEVCREHASDVLGWALEPFILNKREVENYLPDKALRAYAGDDVWNTWRNYDEIAQDHTDLKLLISERRRQRDKKRLWKAMLDPSCQQHLHERAWRERAGSNGRELDRLVEHGLRLL